MDDFNLFKIFDLKPVYNIVTYKDVRFLRFFIEDENEEYTDVYFQPLKKIYLFDLNKVKIYCIQKITKTIIYANEVKRCDKTIYNRSPIQLCNIPDDWVITTDFDITEKIDYGLLA